MLERIKRNPATAIAAVFAALPVIILYLGQIQDAATPLGIDPAVFGITFAILTIGTLAGQAWQAVRDRVTRPVSWGAISITGYVLGAAGVLIPFVDQFREAADPLGLPNGFWFFVGQLLVLATTLFRVWQALGVSERPA